ncbi:unnamed protein product [Effrenium voratum]|nr:unnamed protein product [Effrenium voratum]
MLVTSSPDVLSKQSKNWLRRSKTKRQTLPSTTPRRSTRLSREASEVGQADCSDPRLRPCQRDCLKACAKGARVIEMACGTGKTRVIKEVVQNISGRVLITLSLRALLEQFAIDFPSFGKVGTGYNKDIDWTAQGFLAVTDSVHLLEQLEFDAIFVDEAHHPLPAGFPKSQEVYRFSATHCDEPDFRYSMGQAMEDRILCDYDLTVPVVTPHHGHTYLSLASLLSKQAGRFRRVLAYCNSVREAKNFLIVLEKLGMAAWHMNGDTPPKKRKEILEQFAGALRKPVHVLVTVEVLGEGINIPNADTCMFVEPRSSYRSIVQAIGRVLRPHPAKPLAHIVLPAVALPPEGPRQEVLPAVGSTSVSPQIPVGLAGGSAVANPSVLGHNCYAVQGAQEACVTLMENGVAKLPKLTQASSDDARLRLKEARHEGKLPLQSRNILDSSQPEDQLSERLSMQGWQSSSLLDTSDPAQQDASTAEKCLGTKSPCFPDLAAAGAADPNRNSELVSLGLRRVVSAGAAILNPHLATSACRYTAKGYAAGNAVEAAKGRATCTTAAEFRHEFQARVPTAMNHEACAHSETFCSKPAADGTAGKEGKRGGAAAVQPDWKADDRLLVSAPVAMQHFPGGGKDEYQKEEERHSDNVDLAPRQHQRSWRQLSLQVRTASSRHGFSSELQRFFAALAQADHRLLRLGQTFRHRVQVIDCTAAQHVKLDEVTCAVHAELAAVLRNTDPWEVRFRELEDFVSTVGRLPKERVERIEERTLGHWLTSQGKRFRANFLLPHRLHKLLNASSPLLRERVQKWLSPRKAFEQKCQELQEHIEATGSPPSFSCESAERKLAIWLYAQARHRKLSTIRRRILEDVHPSVKDLLRSWAKTPVRVNAKLWHRRRLELLDFVAREGCLPTDVGGRGLYSWLQLQRRRFHHGQLPAELMLELQRSHPLIAELLHKRRDSARRGDATAVPGSIAK